MKKILFILFLFSSSSYSQVYFPFPTDTAVWSETSHFFFGGGYSYHLILAGDTTFNNQAYKKIYIEYDSIPQGNFLLLHGLLREESNKKIYYYSAATQVEYVLYDFNLTIGDSLFAFYNDGYDSCLVYVWAEDSILIGNNFRKRLSINFGNCFGIPFIINPQWVEGVGDISNGMIYSQIPMFDWWNEMLCFTDSNQLMWSKGIGYCWINLTGLNEIHFPVSNFKISPNPATDFVTLKLNQPGAENFQLAIFDLYGREVLSKSLDTNVLILDTKFLSKGVYVVEVNTGSQTCRSKLVKE